MKKKSAFASVAGAAFVALVVLLWPSEETALTRRSVASEEEEKSALSDVTRCRINRGPLASEEDSDELTQRPVASEEEGAQSEDEPETPEEKAQAAYEKVFDAFVAKQEKESWKPTAADVVRYKAAFDTLTAEQKLEEIPHAQNLFEDTAFDFLKAVLMDPKEPQDVLESIYYDLLNRPEELKYPVLREVHEVKNHPLRKEIEELDEMLGD